MKAIRYPSNIIEKQKLKQKYIDVLSTLTDRYGRSKLELAQHEWQNIRKRLPKDPKFQYPSDIKKILKAEYRKLIAYYIFYINNEHKIGPADKKSLENLFSYDTYHDLIAAFFMDDSNGFDLRVCHYCGTAYINKYTIKRDEKGLDAINNANIKELGKLLKIKKKATLKRIIAGRPYMTCDQFNKSAPFRTPDKFHSVFKQSEDKNHFDLDHVLDKGRCPITAISLMNFVPSCSVCNEKLKRDNVLGHAGTPIEELSPTSPLFDFDRQVTFMLTPKSGSKIGNRPTAHMDDYELEMNVKNPDYNIFVEMFHLRERYEFHKMEALFWLEMKYRYTDSRVALMANSLHDTSFTSKRIKDDIFHKTLDQQEHCFEKLKRDILK